MGVNGTKKLQKIHIVVISRFVIGNYILIFRYIEKLKILHTYLCNIIV
jgi:hypothetical protein